MKTDKAQKQLHIQARRDAHNTALASLATNGKDGLKIWRALRKLEGVAHRHAEAYCNGDTATTPFKGKAPLIHDYRADSSLAWDALICYVKDEIVKIFGHVPEGFFINGDARGHALKLDAERVKIPEGMQTDWGGDGILAAVIE